MSLPRWAAFAFRALAPAEFAEDLTDDLEDRVEAKNRAGQRATWWLVRELLRTPWIRLHGQARRMRRRGTRREISRGGGGGMSGLGTTFRVAARSLLARPSYTAVTLLTLVASIGSATLIFSVLEGVLLRPLPYENGDRIHRLHATNSAWRESDREFLRDNWDRLDLAEDVVVALREGVPGVASVGAFQAASELFEDGEAPERIAGGRVMAGFFETVRLEPLLGRLPTLGEVDAGDPLLVLSERLWMSRYGGDREILGRAITLNGTSHTVIGVLPGAFAVPGQESRWWAPVPSDFAGGRTDVAVFKGLVVLEEGTSADAVLPRLETVVDRMSAANPTYAAMGVRLESLAAEAVDEVKDGILLLFLAVGVVVLIASVNLANLVVARGARRRSELAMRAALGAGRKSLIADIMGETVLLCLVGGGVGVLVATQMLDPFMALLNRATPGFPRAENVGVNGAVLAFSLGVTVVTALLAGLLPALSASKQAPWEALTQTRRSGSARGTRRTQYGLLAAEAALAIVLLSVAGLLVRSALWISNVDPGFDGESVAYLSLETPESRYGTRLEADEFGRALEERLQRLPGTVAVARTSSLPALGGAAGKLVWHSGQDASEGTLIWSSGVSPDYFRAMGVEVVAGRTFLESDGEGAEGVAVVSQLFADQFFPGENPVGRSINVGSGRMEAGQVVAEEGELLTIVGVVGDVRQLTIVMDPDPMLYRPMAQEGARNPHVVLRTSGPPAEILEAARAQVLEADGRMLIQELDVLSRSARRLLAPVEVRTVLILSLAGLAAFLTVVGIYGVVAYIVSDRVHEIGIRMALGARAGKETSRMVSQILRPVLVGTVVGLVLAYFASRLVESGLFGVERLDPVTHVTVPLLMVAVAVLAAWIPARRASSVDPVQVLARD